MANCSASIVRQGRKLFSVPQTLVSKYGAGQFWTVASLAFSTSSTPGSSYQLVVVGGGAGGCATASMFCRKLGKGKVAVIEPSPRHFYQPLWTLVGGGLKEYEKSFRQTKHVLPRDCDWIQDSAVAFDPDNNTVTTLTGSQIKYDYLVCAMGLQLNFNLIKGLPEGFDIDPMICSNFSAGTVVKTRTALESFKEGNAIFTFPNTPIKCPGAPQKIAYLAEEYFRKTGKRDRANILYNSSLPVIFGVPKYAEALTKVVKKRNIQTNFRHNLIEVRPDKKEAVFEQLDTKETKAFPYSMLHVTPPMSTPDALRQSPLVDETGYVPVNRETLQHTKYPNVFAIGDCTNIPVSKTAAAVASQCGVLQKNLTALMAGKEFAKRYDGYTACPLITGKNKCILAEFDWNGTPMETFPVDQAHERSSMYFLKAEVMPQIYWRMLLSGTWHGPSSFRKAFHFGLEGLLSRRKS